MQGNEWARSGSQVPVDSIPRLTWFSGIRDREFDAAAGGSWGRHEGGGVFEKTGTSIERKTTLMCLELPSILKAIQHLPPRYNQMPINYQIAIRW